MPTVLNPGDIAIVHYDTTGPDDFSFVFLTDVTAGTTINFTDNGWLAAGGFRSGEGTVTYTASTAIAAGTIVTLSGLDLDDAGDQIIAYQGSAAAPTILYLIDFGDGNNTVAGDAVDANTTALPPGSALGSNAVAVAFNNAVYAGPTSGTAGQLLIDISDFHNWSGSDSAQQPPRQDAFFTSASGPTLDLDANNSTAFGSDFVGKYTAGGAGAPIGDFDVDIFAFGMSSATITLAINRMQGDLLSINGNLPFGITASSYNPFTGQLTLSGNASPSAYETALHQVVFSSSLSNPSTADRIIYVTCWDGGFATNRATAYIHVEVLQPPVNTVPPAQSVNEDAALTITGLSVADPDSLSLTTRVSVANGTLTVGSGSGAIVSGNGFDTIFISGTAFQINSALNGLTYLGNLNFNGADTLTITTSDGALSDTDTVAITVNPVNDAPVNTVPGPRSVNEDTTLSIGGMSVADVDSSALTTTLSVASGMLNVSILGGATIGGNGTGTVTIGGTATQINTALGGLTYRGTLNFNGLDTLTVTTSDGSLSDADTVAIAVNAVNDAPVNTVPGAQTVGEDTTLAITGVSVADVDSGALSTTVSVAKGTLTVATGGGATIGGNGSGTVTLSGTAGQINSALSGLNYRGTLNFNGSDTLTVTTSDGALNDTNTVPITVAAVNDAPVNTVPGAQSVNEDTTLAIGGVSVADVDSAALTTTLSAASGTINVATGGGATIGGNGTGTVTLSGTATQINNALSGLSYRGNLNFNGSDTLTVSTSDGALTDADPVAITVNAVSDSPVNTVPGAQSVNEDSTLSITGVSVADVDSAALTTTLNVVKGTLTVTLGGGATIGGNGTGTVTLSGTTAQINDALAGLSYRGNLNFNGSDTLTVTTSDGSLSDTDAVSITVNSVDDAPVNTVPGALSVNEDTALPITGISVADVDSTTLTAMLSVVNGTLSVRADGAVITGNGTGSVTVTGTAAQINNALAGLSYLGNLDFNGADTLTVTTSDGLLSDTDTVPITVNAVNDTPVTVTPGAQSVNEDTTLPIAGVSVSDVDSTALTATLSVVNGTLTVTTGGGALITGNGTDTVVVSGTAAQINSALGGLSYLGNLNFNGSDTLTVTASDGSSSDTDLVPIIVNAVNDAPVNTVPSAQTVNEDTTLPIGGVSIADVDSSALTTTLSVTSGTLNVTVGGGAIISGNGSSSVILSGTAAQINSALATLSYRGNLNFNGADTLTVNTSDGSLSDTDTIAIAVNAVNDAPVNTVPGAQSVNEDTALPITGVSVADVDSSALTTTLSVAHGTLTATGTGVSGSGTATLTIVGTGAEINAALGTLNYLGNLNFNGADTLTVNTSDGSLSDTDSVPITVNAVNDAPVNTVPGAQSVNEDTTRSIAGVSVVDVDSSALTTTLSVTSGTLSVTAGGGATIGGNGTGTVTISGTAAQINGVLAGLSYRGNLNFNGADTLTVTSSDGSLSDTDTVPITVNAVNDPPANNVPGAQSVNEDTTLPIAGVSVADVDSAALTTTLSVTSGTLNVTTGGGAVISGNGSDSVTISGTAADINDALATLSYLGDANFNGSDSLTVITSDGSLSDIDTVPITVNSVNDAPVNTVPGAQSVNEDTTLLLTGLSVADVDSPALSTTVTVTSGTLTVALRGGASIGGSGTGTVTLSGTATQINNALASLAYHGTPDFNGSDTLTITTSDGSLSDIETVAITVNPVNDAPVNTVPGPQTVAEDTTLPIAGVSVADVDSTALTTTLTVSNGTLTVTAGGGAVISGDGTATVTISGTAVEINSALAGLSYLGNLNFNGSDTLTVTTSDGSLSDIDVVGIAVGAAGDPPVNTVPGPQTVNEDTALPIAGVSVADIDSTTLTTTLSVASGTLDVTGTGVSGSGTATVTITGSQAQINAALGTLSYLGNSDFNGADTLTVSTFDGSLTDTDTVAITVNPVNDAPLNDVPGAQTVNEDTALLITGVSVADVDSAALTTTLTVTHGTLTATGTGVSGSGTASLTFTGTDAEINAALGTLSYLGNLNFNGSDTLTVTTSDGSLSDTDTVPITVTAVNDAPVNTVPGAQTVDEDTVLPIAGLSVADVDSLVLVTTLTVTNGTLSATGVGVSGDGTGTVRIAGTASQINAALGTLSYLGSADFNGADTLTVTTSDGASSDTDTVPVTVNPVNDAPVNAVPGAQSVDEDTTLPIAGVSVADVDSAALITTLTVASGTLTVAIGGGAVIGGNGSGTVTVSGTAAQINSALAGLSYLGNPDFNGPDTLTVATSDGALTDTDTVALTVNPVNDPPALSLDSDASGGGDGINFFTSYVEGGPATPIADIDTAIADPDDANLVSASIMFSSFDADDRLTINGTLPAGITASAYDPVTGTLTLSGSASLAAYRAALQQIEYSTVSQNPDPGPHILSVTVNDGNVDSNAAFSVIAVAAVNSPPVNTVPGAQSASEDTTLPIAGVSVDDPDSTSLTTTLSVANGILNVTAGAGVSGNGTGTVTITGTAAEINAALAGLSYFGNLNFHGADTLTVATDDAEFTDTDTVAITVSSVDDAPVNTVPGGQSVNEDTALPIAGLSVADVDSPLLHTTLSVAHGTLTATGTGVSDSGTSTVTIVGTAAEITAALGTLTYLGNLNFNGSDTLTVTTSDGPTSDTDIVAITVSPVNDPPVNTVPGAQSADEDTSLQIGGVSVAAVDSPTLTTTLAVASGTLTVATGGGATIGGNGSATVTVAGTPAQINSALAGLSYLGNLDFNGSDTLTVITSDGSLSDTDTVAITVNPVDDAPVNTVPGAQSVNEDTSLPIAGLSVADVDTPGLLTTLTVAHGTLTATGAGVSGSGTATLTIAGPAGDINFALGTLTYLGDLNFNGADTLTVTTSDGSLNDTDTVAITVNPMNDPPVNTVPGAQSVDEDTSLSIGGVAVADVDNTALTTTLSVANGTLTVATGGGATVGGNGTGTVTIAGSATQINSALAGLSYLGNLDFNGGDILTVTTSDGSSSDTDAIAITVNPVDDVPVNVVPGPQTVNEDTALPITGLSVVDTDSPLLVTTLAVAHGTLTATGTGVSGSGSATLTIAGTGTEVNAALGTLTYLGVPDFNGADTLTVTTSDSSFSDTDTVAISVNPVNDPPVNTMPAPLTADEDTVLPIAGLSVADVDSSSLVITLSVTNGTLTATGAGVSGSGTGTLTIAGTAAQINTALAMLGYLGNPDFNGADTLTVTTSDGSLSDTDAVAITVNPVDDAPVNTVPGTIIAEEDALLAIAGLSVADLDSATLTTTLTVAHGVLVANGAGVGGNGTATLTIAGTAAQINTALSTLTYLGELNFSGDDTLTVATFDGSQTVTDIVPLVVIPANDAPLLDLDSNGSSGAIGGNYAAIFIEGGTPTPIADKDVSIIDVDSAFLQFAIITLTNRAPGDLLLVGTLPVGISASPYDPATGVLTLTGTLATPADFAAALQNVAFFSTDPNPIATDRLISVVVKDDASSSNTADTFIRLLPVNTAPTLDLDADNSTAPGRAYHANFTAGTTPVAVAGTDVRITDADNTTLGSATVTIANLKPNDVLSVNGALPGGISTAGFNPATGMLTLTGTASLADYQTALHQIEYSNSSLTPDTTTRQIAITVNDGTANSTAAFAFIGVLDQPATLDLDANDSTATGSDYATSFTEGGAAALIADTDVSITGSASIIAATITLTNPLAGDLIAVAGTLPGSIVTSGYDPSTGVLGLSGTGTLAEYQAALQQITYKNASDNPATDQRVVSVTVDDGTGDSNAALAFIQVNAVNDPPVLAVAPAATYTERTAPVTLSPVVSVGDPDDPVLTVAAVAITGGALPGDSLTLGGAPTGRSGAITFTYMPALEQMILSGPGTLSEYQALFQSVQFSSSSHDPTDGGADPTRTISWFVFDGTTQVTQTTTLTINPVNDPPVNTLPASFTANPNVDTPITGLAVADPDAGTGTLLTVLGVGNGTLTVTSAGGATIVGSGSATVTILGTLAQINATLSAAGGVLYRAFPGFTSDTVTMFTDDGGSTGILSRTDSDTSGIAFAGSPPTGIALSSAGVNEFTPDGTVVGTLSATDPDPGDTFTFALTDDAGGRFAIDGANLVVRHGLLLDFEQAAAHTVTVQVTDSGGQTLVQSFVIGIGNVDPENVTPSAALTGAPGGDVIVGGPLDDRIGSGPGNDTLTGAAGTDTAVFSAPLGSTTPDDFGQWIDISGADGSDRLFSFENLQFPDGTVHVNDGDPLFDTLYYDHRYLDVFHFPADARAHYENTGWLEGRDPNAFFSNDGYLSAYHAVLAREGGLPSPTGAGPLTAAQFALTNPLEHYRDIGWREGLDPSISFDTTLYLLHNPDVAAAGVNPLAHFLANGRAEGRVAYPAIGPSIVGGFDAEYYLLAYPDIARAGADPLLHYETVGWREGRNPNAYFDTSGYLAAYPDVAAAGVNPLLHYEQSGWHEGRDPSGRFDTLHYLAAYPDVAAANVSPLDHFLQSGAYEGRLNFADGVFFH